MKPLVLALFSLVFCAGCSNSTCDIDAENYRQRECAIKIEAVHFAGRWFSIKGSNARNGGFNRYVDRGRWYAAFENSIAIGDTLIKRKNELVFYIHKKDTVLSFPFECNGQVIK